MRDDRPGVRLLESARACLIGLALIAVVAQVSPASAEARGRDADGDGLRNRFERKRSHTNPQRADTDRDGLRDRFELRRSKTNPRKKDTDRDHLRDRFELRRSKTNPRKKDTDGDGLRDRFELRRSKTNPRKKDTDGDGLSDRFELRRSKTNPRKKDTDGDGVSDGAEIRAGTNPNKPDAPRLLTPPAPPVSGASPSCVSGATNAGSAAAVRSALQAGQNVCVTANVGNVDLSNLRPGAVRYVGTPGVSGGSMNDVKLANAANITIRARLRSTEIYDGANNVRLDNCVVGGTSGARVIGDDLIRVQADATNIVVENCDIGWTGQTSSTDAGYGLRILDNGNVANITIQGNRIHHISEDGIQVGGKPPNLTIDRNEIAYIATDTASIDPHADLIQLVGYGPNTRITNNYMHHLGYRDESHQPANSYPSGGFYLHGGQPGPLIIENNLGLDWRNMGVHGSLGTGGCSGDQVIVRRNTFLRGGTSVGGTEFRMTTCSGSGNVLERNAIENLDVPSPGGHLSVRANVTGGNVKLDGNGNCTSAACNPAGQEPIGFRKPSGVRW